MSLKREAGWAGEALSRRSRYPGRAVSSAA